MSKNGAGRGSCVQKGTIAGKKWSAHPKMGQEVVGTSKNRARRCLCGQKGTIQGEKDSARPKIGQKGVCMSQKGMVPGKKGSARPKLSRKGSNEGQFRARRGRQVPQWDR